MIEKERRHFRIVIMLNSSPTIVVCDYLVSYKLCDYNLSLCTGTW